MTDFLKRNGALVVGLLLGGVIMLLCLPIVENARGDHVPAILQARSMLALPAVILCFAVATLIAGGVARLTNGCVGLFVLGGAVFALDYRLDTINAVLLGGSLSMMVLELLIWAALTFAAVRLVFKVGGPLEGVHPDEEGRTPSWYLSVEALKLAAAGLIIVPAVWVLAQSELKGQAVGAVTVGAIGAGLAGRLLSPHVQPILAYVAPLVFGAVGYIIGIVAVDGTPAELFVNGNVPPLLRPAPLDYLCGTLAGVSVGYGWARSFLQHEEEDDEQPVPAGRGA